MSEKKGLSLRELVGRPDNGKAPLKERLSEEEYKRRERKSDIILFAGLGVAIVIGVILGFMMIPSY